MQELIEKIERNLPDWYMTVRRVHPREHWAKTPEDRYLGALRYQDKFPGSVFCVGRTAEEALRKAYEKVLHGTGAGADM